MNSLKKLALFSKHFSVVQHRTYVKRARDEKFGKIGGISHIFGFYCIFFTKYFQIFGKNPKNLALIPKNLALFSVTLSKKRARDEKFGKIGGISQIFGFYCIFITKFFQVLTENAKKLALFSKLFSVVYYYYSPNPSP